MLGVLRGYVIFWFLLFFLGRRGRERKGKRERKKEREKRRERDFYYEAKPFAKA